MNELTTSPAIRPQGAAATALATREAQEVQAAVFMAKTYPRDEKVAFEKIMAACANPLLAEEAEYAYQRGGVEVAGPSIRLLETCARYWGNCQAGIKVLSSGETSSEVESFCWDYESNFREAITFRVEHVRDTQNGPKPLTSERDIYEIVANMGARRKRKCLEIVIPSYIVQAARQECDKTLGGMAEKKERVLAMIKAFQDEFRVTREDIERRIGKRIEAMTTPEFVMLKKIFASLRAKMSQVSDWFPQVLDPEKIKKAQADGAEVPPHAGNQAAVDAERKVALQEFDAAVARLEDKGWPIEEIEKKLRKPIAEVRKGDVKALQFATDLIKD
jgi:hypothetical protein